MLARRGVRVGILTRLGGQGTIAARGARSHRRELRADPPLEPDRYGRSPPSVPGGDIGGQPRAHRARGLRGNGLGALNEGEIPKEVIAVRAGVTFAARVRIDTPMEAAYFRHGGILHYVLRQLAG